MRRSVDERQSEGRDLRLMVIKEVILDTLGLDRAAAVAAQDGDKLLLTRGGETVQIRASGGRLYVEKLVG